MKSNKNTQTYLSKYIKHRILIIRGKVRNKTLKKPIIYKILNKKNIKNNDFIEKRPTNSSIYKQEQNTAKSKRDVQRDIKR